MIAHISRENLAERVERILRRYIRDADLQTGARLPSERELAGLLGVSQGVLREALSALMRAGIVVKQHGRGNFVGTFDRALLQELPARLSQELPAGTELSRARCVLEIGAMFMAALWATEEDLAELRRLVESMKIRVERRKSIAAEEFAFHKALLRASHNPPLEDLLWIVDESMRMNVYSYPLQLGEAPGDESMFVREHEIILEALERRDGPAASQAMYRHLRSTLEATGPGQGE